MSGGALTWHARRVISILAQRQGPVSASSVAASVVARDATVRVVLGGPRERSGDERALDLPLA
jgi:hypothetical protein